VASHNHDDDNNDNDDDALAESSEQGMFYNLNLNNLSQCKQQVRKQPDMLMHKKSFHFNFKLSLHIYEGPFNKLFFRALYVVIKSEFAFLR